MDLAMAHYFISCFLAFHPCLTFYPLPPTHFSIPAPNPSFAPCSSIIADVEFHFCSTGLKPCCSSAKQVNLASPPLRTCCFAEADLENMLNCDLGKKFVFKWLNSKRITARGVLFHKTTLIQYPHVYEHCSLCSLSYPNDRVQTLQLSFWEKKPCKL